MLATVLVPWNFQCVRNRRSANVAIQTRGELTMKTNRSLISITATIFAIVAMWTGAGTIASAQNAPPAQGPPAASQSASTLPVSAITTTLMKTINDGVAAENASLAVDPNHRATLSASYQTWPPVMTQTQYTDRPNERIASIYYIVTYKVSNISGKVLGFWVGYPFDRTITQSIEIQVSCNG